MSSQEYPQPCRFRKLCCSENTDRVSSSALRKALLQTWGSAGIRLRFKDGGRKAEAFGGVMDPRSNMVETQRVESLREKVAIQDFKPGVEEINLQSQQSTTVGNKSPSPSVLSESSILRRGQLSSFNRSIGRSSRRSMNWGSGADTARLSTSGSSMRRKGLKEMILQSSQVKAPWLAAAQRESVPVDISQDLETLSDGNLEDLSLVLDPLEHEWMLTVADGNAESILNLLAKDPSLLSRRDFVTGFTVLHWLAKHGRHEDLIEVISFAERNCLPFDVNVLTASGRLTPLHLAALQGHEMVIKVLVGAFGANTNLRDHNGLKAWQYLRPDVSRELKELSGACEEDLVLPGAGNTNNNCAPSRWRRINTFKGECEDTKGARQSQQAIPRFSYLRNVWRQALAFFQER